MPVARRAVAGGELRAGDPRQVGREQRALQRAWRSRCARRRAARCRARAPRAGRGPPAARARPRAARRRARRSPAASAPERAPARAQRDDDARAVDAAARPSADLRQRSPAAAVEHRLGGERPLALGVAGHRDRPPGRSRVAAEHDQARVGQVAHAQLGDAAQRALLVERLVEQRARLGQQGGARQQPLALGLGAAARGDVAHHHDELAAGRRARDLERDAGELEHHAAAVAAPDRQRVAWCRRDRAPRAGGRAARPPRAPPARRGRRATRARSAPGTCSR